MPAALVIFTPDVARLAAFYEAVLGASRAVEASGDIRLTTEKEEVLIHSISASAAKRVTIATPPRARSDVSMKPVFDVSSLVDALEAVRAGGGVVTSRSFTFSGLARHDVVDPDGNVIQLRSPA